MYYTQDLDDEPAGMLSPQTVFRLLLFVLLIVAGSAVLYAVIPPRPSVVATGSDPAVQQLTALRPGPAAAAVEFPAWIAVLVAVFAVLQIFPLLVASSLAQYRPLSRRSIRKISFLCETPMYLGLLGSLLGVCITQFTTGSLAAPLAYITTISGIVLYLFAKLTIWLSLPESSELGD